METIAYKHVATRVVNKPNTTQKTQEFWEMLEFYRFGVAAWTLAIVACFSGIVAGLFVDGSSQLEITLVAAPVVATLITILAVAPVRWVLGVGITAILINIILMMF